MGVNVESMSLVLATDNGLEIFFLVFLFNMINLSTSSYFQIFDSVFRLTFMIISRKGF
jgi:hypothetical protein